MYSEVVSKPKIHKIYRFKDTEIANCRWFGLLASLLCEQSNTYELAAQENRVGHAKTCGKQFESSMTTFDPIPHFLTLGHTMASIKQLLLTLSLLVGYGIAQGQPFSAGQDRGKISHPELNELSGIVESKRYPGYFWVHNDSGDKARVFLIDSTAQHRATVEFTGMQARDWEDIALMERGGRHYLVVGDIGDNKAQYEQVYIHLLEEPQLALSDGPIDTLVDMEVRTYTFTYPEGPRDAESLFYDPVSRQLYLITKRELHVSVYRVDFPDHPERTGALILETSLPLTYVTAADMSVDGTELVVKNLLEIHYWHRNEGESVVDMLRRPSIRLPYSPEPQGEAITFRRDGQGYVTISEQALGLEAVLYHYPRVIH